MIVANEDRGTKQTAPEESLRRAALGALINIAGRQRMLSHRAVMFLALSQLPNGGSAEAQLVEAETALSGFDAGVRLLLEGDPERSIPALFSERVANILTTPAANHPSGRAAIEAFSLQGAGCLESLRRGDANVGGDIRQLADLCGLALLPMFNAIVAAFEADLAETLEAEAARAADIRAVMTHALDDIEQTATKIRLIAFNALIEAARAGDAGRAFSVIAEEIKNLGAQTRQESAKMQSAIARLFAA